MKTEKAERPESIGSMLRDARMERGLELSEASRQVRVPEQYLAAFEEDDYWRLGNAAYARLYLKAYAEFLGFNATTLMNLFRKNQTKRVGDSLRETTNRAPKRELPAWTMMVAPRIIQGLLVALVIIGTATYFGFEFKRMMAPPAISIFSPDDGLVTSERSISVIGRTEREIAVRINGKTVSPDDSGNFRDSLELREGLNIITVKGSKKHSKDTTLTRRVIFTPDEATADIADTEPATLSAGDNVTE